MAAASSAEKDECIAQFIGITGTDRERASFFLESSGWKLQVALESFYDDSHGDDVVPPAANPPSGTSAELPMDEPGRLPSTGGGGAGGGSGGGSRGSGYSARGGSSSSRVATLGDYTSAKADSDEEGQAFYAGGADHGSGQQVVGPKKKKKEGSSDGLVKDIFKQAREHGAEEVASGATPSTSRGGTSFAFRGAGYRLGESQVEPTVPVPGTAGTMPGPRPKERHVILKMWKNGFSIDDGELRDYRSPENDLFLKSIMKGEIPDELLKLAEGGEVSLDLEDRRNEEYVRPKQTVKAFTGHGYMLGSPAPSIVSGGSSSQSGSTSTSQSSSSTTTPASVDVDPAQPVTTVQLRLADGSRLVGKFNHTHTVGSIRSFIVSSRPQYAGQSFVLMTTFPNKTLGDDAQTIADAKLLNAVIVQRLT
ncbi:NSFL1 cofactor p47-like [Diadema setosum]|uniref:NSFL1 cofactor p47-like n=1 Tax=Diadema setosum TaxID=31175 RepID=UPI003B3B1313